MIEKILAHFPEVPVRDAKAAAAQAAPAPAVVPAGHALRIGWVERTGAGAPVQRASAHLLLLRDADEKPIADVGHMIYPDRPRQFAAAIEDCLACSLLLSISDNIES